MPLRSEWGFLYAGKTDPNLISDGGWLDHSVVRSLQTVRLHWSRLLRFVKTMGIPKILISCSVDNYIVSASVPFSKLHVRTDNWSPSYRTIQMPGYRNFLHYCVSVNSKLFCGLPYQIIHIAFRIRMSKTFLYNTNAQFRYVSSELQTT